MVWSRGVCLLLLATAVCCMKPKYARMKPTDILKNVQILIDRETPIQMSEDSFMEYTSLMSEKIQNELGIDAAELQKPYTEVVSLRSSHNTTTCDFYTELQAMKNTNYESGCRPIKNAAEASAMRDAEVSKYCECSGGWHEKIKALQSKTCDNMTIWNMHYAEVTKADSYDVALSNLICSKDTVNAYCFGKTAEIVSKFENDPYSFSDQERIDICDGTKNCATVQNMYAALYNDVFFLSRDNININDLIFGNDGLIYANFVYIMAFNSSALKNMLRYTGLGCRTDVVGKYCPVEDAQYLKYTRAVDMTKDEVNKKSQALCDRPTCYEESNTQACAKKGSDFCIAVLVDDFKSGNVRLPSIYLSDLESAEVLAFEALNKTCAPAIESFYARRAAVCPDACKNGLQAMVDTYGCCFMSFRELTVSVRDLKLAGDTCGVDVGGPCVDKFKIGKTCMDFTNLEYASYTADPVKFDSAITSGVNSLYPYEIPGYLYVTDMEDLAPGTRMCLSTLFSNGFDKGSEFQDLMKSAMGGKKVATVPGTGDLVAANVDVSVDGIDGADVFQVTLKLPFAETALTPSVRLDLLSLLVSICSLPDSSFIKIKNVQNARRFHLLADKSAVTVEITGLNPVHTTSARARMMNKDLVNTAFETRGGDSLKGVRLEDSDIEVGKPSSAVRASGGYVMMLSAVLAVVTTLW